MPNIKTKILFADQNSTELELLQNELKKSGIDYVYQFAKNKDDFSSALKDFSPDIILCDLSCPSFDGTTAFNLRQEINPEIPFIFIADPDAEEITVSYINYGGTDYVLKDKMFTLIPKIRKSLKEAIEKKVRSIVNDTIRIQADLLNTIGQAVVAADNNGIISFWNKTAEETYGWNASEAIGSKIQELILSQQTDAHASEIMSALHHGNSWSGEMILQRKDGRTFTGLLTESPVYDSNLKLSGVIIITCDLSERRKIEDKLNKSNRLYSFHSQINKTITLVTNEQSLFSGACQIARDSGNFKMAWVGKVNTTSKTIHLEEECGIPPDSLGLFKDALYEKGGPQDYVLSTGTSYISNNLEKDLKIGKWKEFARKHNIRSCIVLPLKKSGTITATLNLYSSEQNFFDEAEIHMLEEVAIDLSFGMDLIEMGGKHRHTEELILQSENRFRALIEKSSDMETLAGVGGKIFYASPSVSKVLGYSLEDFINTPSADIIHPDDIPSFTENIHKLLQSPGSSFSSRHRLKHKNGNYIWCEGTITNMFHEPHVNALVSNFRDITDKLLIEKQQEFNSNNLTALINNTSDLMWSVDTDFNLITYNKAFYDIVKLLSGNTVELVVGMNVLDFGFSDAQTGRYKVYYERAFRGEAFTELEYTDDPIEYWTEISFCPIRKGSEIIGTACHSHNITDIKKSERQIKESEAFTHGILNTLSSHIAVIDESGEIVAVNESWKQFAISNGENNMQHTCIGSNYYQVCEKAANKGDETAAAALRGLKAVMNKDKSAFYLEYPCHSPHVQRWYGMRATKFANDLPLVVVVHMDITERKLAEERSLKSEARLKEAQSIAHLCNWEIDLRNNTHTWSDEFYNIFGLNREEVEPSTDAFLSNIHPEDAHYAHTEMQHAFASLKDSSMDFRFILKDGTINYGYTAWKFEFDKYNNPVRLYGILQDRTEQKKAELILKESESRLAEAQAIAHFSNWEIDMVNNITTWSDELFKIFGIRKDEVKPSTELFYTFIHHEDVMEVKKSFQETLETFQETSSSFRFIRTDGTVGFAYLERKVELNENNKPVRIYGIFHDITDQKKLESIIVKSEARLAEAQALAKVGNWETDLLTMNVIWSDETYRIFEINPADFHVTHPSVLEHVHPEDKEKVDLAFKNSFNTTSINSIEHRILTPSGTIKMVEERWQIFQDENGVPCSAVGTCQDITTRKKAEEEREKLINDLVQRNRDLEQFAFIISHNLRAPTANIIGFTEILQEESLSQIEQKELLQGLATSVSGLDGVIKDLNSILQTKREVNDNKELISFSKLVEDISISMGNLIDKHHVQILTDFKRVDEIFSLKPYMHSIFHNLISNSIKYSRPDESPLIEIRSKFENGNIILTFKDNGLGIDLTTKGDKVFGLYKRFHSHVDGKGMGLFMVKTQVEAMGGKISVASELNKGTEFIIVFENKPS